jgi:hypothetical protein
MKRWIGAVVIGLLLLVGVTKSEAVFSVVGASGACDTTLVGCQPIPLTVSALCGPLAGCPNLSAQSFTDVNRFWGGGGSTCRTSSNGGVTWAACTTSPGLTGGAMQHYAGASDGSVIGVGQIGTTCTIKRSVDNASNWVTVYSNAVSIGCGAGTNGGTLVKCINDGQCNFLFNNTNTNLPGLIASTDNGQNWVLTTVGVAANVPMSLAWDGTAGILTSNTLRSLKYTGGAWSQGTAQFAGCGIISGSVVYNGVGYGLCKAIGVNEDYRLMTADGALFKTITLPGAFTGGGGIGVLAFSVQTNQLYVIANAATTPAIGLGIWVSRDDGVSFTQIYTSSQLLNSMTQNNDIFFSNGCVYFSGGTGPMFGKIC